MEALLIILTLVALLGAWVWFFNLRKGRGQRRTPLSAAFTLTFVAVMYLTAGAVGFTLDKRARFFAATAM